MWYTHWILWYTPEDSMVRSRRDNFGEFRHEVFDVGRWWDEKEPGFQVPEPILTSLRILPLVCKGY